MAVRVRCLGGLRVEQDGTQPAFAYQKAKALVVYLVLNRRPVSRRALAELLWGEVPEQKGRAGLRVVLHDVRRSLGEVLVAEGDEVGLAGSAPVATDVLAFEAAVDDGAWDQAVTLYRGPFLDGFSVERAPGFDQWVLQTRERLHQVAATALLARAEEHEAAGATASAVAVLGRMVALDPWDEEARRRLMAVLAGSGRPAAALDVYRGLAHHLAVEAGDVPEDPTMELAEWIAAGSRPNAPVAAASQAHLTHGAFIGRKAELAALEELVAGGARIVTLSGPGGVGKTRLAEELLGGLGGGPGPTWAGTAAFVDLAGVDTATEIPMAVARSLHLPLLGVRPPFDEVVAALRDTPVLVVLDNMEHLLPDGAGVVSALVSRCPRVVVVATSRRRLGLRAERVVRVRPLDLPPPDGDPATSAASPSVALFLERAAEGGVPLDPTDPTVVADVAELCRRLDGLPLAIEFGALQMRYRTPAEALLELGSRPGELGDHSGDRPSRHRTLLDSVDWSYRMLDDDAQRLLRALAVFRGGCALDVLAGDRSRWPSVATLVDAGLLDRREADGVTRLVMMESTRTFALTELERRGELADAESRHCAAHLELATRADAALRGRAPGQIAWLDRLDREADNLTAALRYACEHDVASGLALANALAWFWHIHGRLQEGSAWLARLVELGDGQVGTGQVGTGQVGTGQIGTGQVGTGRAVADAVLNLARFAIRRGDDGSPALLDRAERLLGDLDDRIARCEVAHLRVQWSLTAGPISDHALADKARLLRTLVTTLDREGAPWDAARVLLTLATILHLEGDHAGAAAAAREGLSRFEQAADVRGRGAILVVLGLATQELGDVQAGRRQLEEALEHLLAVGDHVQAIHAVLALGGSYLVAGDDVTRGATLLGVGARLLDNAGAHYPALFQASIDRYTALRRPVVGDPAWQEAWNRGWEAGLGAVAVAVPERSAGSAALRAVGAGRAGRLSPGSGLDDG
ncbi:MAG TPA: BTAD domain-containing putative transcriptional regulator [Acidimicrobiales bacterium]|nr:BTAD domain-containing putative transcriptional regulator [Acidimicrobiales bacterium]